MSVSVISLDIASSKNTVEKITTVRSQICQNLGAFEEEEKSAKKDIKQLVENSNFTNITGFESAAPICTMNIKSS